MMLCLASLTSIEHDERLISAPSVLRVKHEGVLNESHEESFSWAAFTATLQHPSEAASLDCANPHALLSHAVCIRKLFGLN